MTIRDLTFGCFFVVLPWLILTVTLRKYCCCDERRTFVLTCVFLVHSLSTIASAILFGSFPRVQHSLTSVERPFLPL